MLQSDDRVGVMTEGVRRPRVTHMVTSNGWDLVMGSAIRMVKLFGWERRISERIDKKRQEELHALRNFRILTLFNNITKCVDIPSREYIEYSLGPQQYHTSANNGHCFWHLRTLSNQNESRIPI